MHVVRPSVVLAALAAFTTAQLPVWQQRFPSTSPGSLLALTYDEIGCRTLGVDHDPSGFVRVWRWDGLAWTVSCGGSPPAAASTTLATCYDTRRNTMVMVRYTGSNIETWELGLNCVWTRVFPAGAPFVSSADLALHYSPSRASSLLVSKTSPSAPLTVWEYVGSSWIQRTTAPTTLTQGASNTAYDTRRNRIVKFSGSSTVADTWEWDGNSWIQQQPPNSPPARVTTAIAYDPNRSRCVLQGGSTANPFTWEWNGVNWTINAAAPPAAPSGRMTADTVRGRVIYVATGGPLETWEYFSPLTARYNPFGAGCSGSGGVPALAANGDSLPWLGGVLMSRISNLPGSPLSVPFGLLGSSRQNWLGIPLPFDMAPFGAAGCTLLTSVELSAQLTNAGGSAIWSVPIPKSVALLGTHFYQQALVLDPLANRFGATFSNAVQAVIGDR